MDDSINHKLYEITQVAEVYADAMVRDENGDVMFLSCYGRDTAIKEMMARIQLSTSTDAITQLTLVSGSGSTREMSTGYLMQPKELTYHSGRLPRGLFGQLVHAWIYNPVILLPDRGAQQAWVIEPTVVTEALDLALSQGQLKAKVWQAVQSLSSVPLLTHWQDTILRHIWDDMVFEMGVSHSADFSPRLSVPVGRVAACRIRLSDQFAQRICDLVRAKQLSLAEPAQLVHSDLALAA
jgi:hypothetical protein